MIKKYSMKHFLCPTRLLLSGATIFLLLMMGFRFTNLGFVALVLLAIYPWLTEIIELDKSNVLCRRWLFIVLNGLIITSALFVTIPNHILSIFSDISIEPSSLFILIGFGLTALCICFATTHKTEKSKLWFIESLTIIFAKIFIYFILIFLEREYLLILLIIMLLIELYILFNYYLKAINPQNDANWLKNPSNY